MTPKHGWDPQTYGCKCTACPLGPNGFLSSGEWAPVPGEFHPGASVLAITEAPVDEDTKYGRPLVGNAGMNAWNPALESIGKLRTDVDIDHVISCQPPGAAGGAWKRMESALKAENDKREAEGREPWIHPTEACAPRFQFMVSRYRDLIALGGTAAKALLKTDAGIFSIRGGPRELPTSDPNVKRRVLPTFHPSFVQRALQWREVFQADLAKAFRWFEGKRTWIEPYVRIRPSLAEIDAFLSEEPPYGYDVYDYETVQAEGEPDGTIEALTARVRCVGFGRRIHDTWIRCEQCLGTGRTVYDWHAMQGWLPSASPGQVCARCEGRGQRVVIASAIVIPIVSIDGYTRFYSTTEEAWIKERIRVWARDLRRKKAGHNAGYYDRMVSEQWLGVTPAPMLDTLFPARMRSPDLPKSLGVIGSILTDVHAWKNDAEGNKLAYGARSDWELHYYCALDCVVNALIIDPLLEAVERTGGNRPIREDIKPASWPAGRPFTLIEVDHNTQHMCVGLHYIGAYIDQERRNYHEARLTKDAIKYREIAVTYAEKLGVKGAFISQKRGYESFNPGSNDQLAEVLYEKWGLVPKHFTETGAPSVADEVKREILTQDLAEERPDPSKGKLAGERWAFLDAVRRYNRAIKARGTFCYPLRLRSADPENGKAWSDGRVRGHWSAHSTAVGRLSSSDNNQQNVPPKLRDMYAAALGHAEVGSDLDQIHLRIIANRWGIQRLLDGFSRGIDPHCSLAFDFFGAAFVNAAGWGPKGFSLLTADKPKKNSDADRMRQIAKIIRYRGAYWDTAEGIRQSVIKTEDEDGNLLFSHFTDRQVRLLYKTWMEAEPEWERAWQMELDRFHRNGWLESAVLGRRSGQCEGGKKEKVVNEAILPAEPDIMRLVESDVMQAFPFFAEGPGTGMVNQCHDSLNIERAGHIWEEPKGRTHQGPDVYWRPLGKDRILCWERKLEWDRKTLEECMSRTLPGWPIPITAEAKVGRNWAEA